MNNNCNYRHTERIGLYIMVFIILCYSCGISDNVDDIESNTDDINNKLTYIQNNVVCK